MVQDHALEQVNKDIKATGGVVGMSTDALDKYCYIASLNQALLAKFLSEFGLTNVQYSNNQFVHHKDRASFRTFHNLNFVKYSESLKEILEIPLQDTDSVFNVMTASVLYPSKDVLNIKEVGEVMYTEFLEKRRTGTDVSVWDTMHKRKLLTFKTSARVIDPNDQAPGHHEKQTRDRCSRTIQHTRVFCCPSITF